VTVWYDTLSTASARFPHELVFSASPRPPVLKACPPHHERKNIKKAALLKTSLPTRFSASKRLRKEINRKSEGEFASKKENKLEKGFGVKTSEKASTGSTNASHHTSFVCKPLDTFKKAGMTFVRRALDM